MSTLRIARLVAAKDLRIEWNSRVFVNQVLPFAGVTMVIFAFALDADSVLQRVAPGLVWLATMFSMLVLIQRSFAVETADGALDALRVAGVDPRAIYLGKAVALGVQLLVLEVVLLLAAPCMVGAVCSVISMFAHDRAQAWHDVASVTRLVRARPWAMDRSSPAGAARTAPP